MGSIKIKPKGPDALIYVTNSGGEIHFSSLAGTELGLYYTTGILTYTPKEDELQQNVLGVNYFDDWFDFFDSVGGCQGNPELELRFRPGIKHRQIIWHKRWRITSVHYNNAEIKELTFSFRESSHNNTPSLHYKDLHIKDDDAMMELINTLPVRYTIGKE